MKHFPSNEAARRVYVNFLHACLSKSALEVLFFACSTTEASYGIRNAVTAAVYKYIFRLYRTNNDKS